VAAAAVGFSIAVALATSPPPDHPYPLHLDARVTFDAEQHTLPLLVRTSQRGGSHEWNTLTLEFDDGLIRATPLPHGSDGGRTATDAGAAPLAWSSEPRSTVVIPCQDYDCSNVDVVIEVTPRMAAWTSTLAIELVATGSSRPPSHIEIEVVKR
jgi:hypothetical protein